MYSNFRVRTSICWALKTAGIEKQQNNFIEKCAELRWNEKKRLKRLKAEKRWVTLTYVWNLCFFNIVQAKEESREEARVSRQISAYYISAIGIKMKITRRKITEKQKRKKEQLEITVFECII